jgi:hypothetical protein
MKIRFCGFHQNPSQQNDIIAITIYTIIKKVYFRKRGKMGFKAELLRDIIQDIRYRYDEDISNEQMRDLLLGEYKEDIPHSTWGTWIGDEVKQIKIIRKDASLRHALEKSMQLPSDIWSMSEEEQKKILHEHTILFVRKLKGAILDFSMEELFPNFEDLSQEHKSILINIQSMDEGEIKRFVQSSIESEKIFFKTPENQPILLKLSELFYIRGFYDVLNDAVFNNMFEPSLNRFEMRLMRAHSLGFHSDTSRVREAAEILKDLADKTDDNKEKIDYLTSAISNIRRAIFSKNNSDHDYKRIFKLLINHYDRIKDEANGEISRHYYPAINLAYMVVLAQTLYPDEIGFKQYNIQQIHRESRHSIEQECETPNHYYAKISDLEFLMLQQRDFELFKTLQKIKPSISMVKRTKRQIEFFQEALTLQVNHYPTDSSKKFLDDTHRYITSRENELKELFMYLKNINNIDEFLYKLSQLLDLLSEDIKLFSDNKQWLREIIGTAKHIASSGIQLSKVAQMLYLTGGDPKEIETLLREAFKYECDAGIHGNAIHVAQRYFNLLRSNILIKEAYSHESRPLQQSLIALRYKLSGGSTKQSIDWFITNLSHVDNLRQLQKLSLCFIKVFAGNQPYIVQKITQTDTKEALFSVMSDALDTVGVAKKEKDQLVRTLLKT